MSSSPGLDHARQESLPGPDRAEDVDGVEPFDRRRLGGDGGSSAADTRIRPQHARHDAIRIETPGEAQQGIPVRDVDLFGAAFDLGVAFANRAPRRIAVDVGGDNVHARIGEVSAQEPPDPASRAGDERPVACARNEGAHCTLTARLPPVPAAADRG